MGDAMNVTETTGYTLQGGEVRFILIPCIKINSKWFQLLNDKN